MSIILFLQSTKLSTTLQANTYENVIYYSINNLYDLCIFPTTRLYSPRSPESNSFNKRFLSPFVTTTAFSELVVMCTSTGITEYFSVSFETTFRISISISA